MYVYFVFFVFVKPPIVIFLNCLQLNHAIMVGYCLKVVFSSKTGFESLEMVDFFIQV